MKILGIDPGLDRTGWAVLEKGGQGGAARLLASGLIHTSKSLALEKRLDAIYDRLVSVIAANTPCVAAIEEVFFSKRADTQANTTHARGVILLACEKQSLPISAYNPREIKKTVSGNGAADKVQMQKIVQIILGLKEIPKPDDVADAMAAALCHLRLAPLRLAMKNATKRLQIKGNCPGSRFSGSTVGRENI
ncbi:MAG: crossover junction endodeoxyribonuclease RuvC [Elusimicrobia bacterium GWF2_52_66]|nr:MAG: crossover junction endodeoxyribonuclease RuvC [Elusimicrobia bacterium GWA2_51_34]OGR88152.1 MAG: crossover junction endodeoxyribonuclease RuvC [Elusimicrobia bacterium GWF2_52_66]HAF95355.1 crossover junction endodeoxyribonuclease RuvC [Elusimicrobiota bacterium]HCE98781.1 crossover junction endodeoxyribonuclease RuvC [Elusimicrobiota bacterium]